ncbi:transketolase family protein [Euzebya rosea]|uniref:transketolase family protein n=1 Tax=Euzebya rosea TaxID=2052804 RepID=UPI000D3E403C|nr:transketolase [Euzebya rosea]
MRDEFIEQLLSVATNDASIRLVTGDLGFGIFDAYRHQIPKQFINVGVAEQFMMGFAAGLAMEGCKVITYSIGNFATMRCLEQIRNDVAYHQLPVIVVAVGAGFGYGPLGYSHHATEDIAIMRAIPNMNVYAPGDASQAREALTECLEQGWPAYIRLERGSSEEVSGDFRGGWASPGDAAQREGNAVALVGVGGTQQIVERASKTCGATPVYLSRVKPLPESFVRFLDGFSNVVVVEEHNRDGGVYEAISCRLRRKVAHFSVSVPNVLSSVVGSQEYMRSTYGLDAESVSNMVLGEVLA